MYDGYRFSAKAREGIYNPFSLLQALDESELQCYWFETGVPVYPVRVMQRAGQWIYDFVGKEVDPRKLVSVSNPYQNLNALLYQAGFLTLGEPGQQRGTYRLRFPNGEVEEGFRLLAEGNADRFMDLLAAFCPVSNYEVAGKLEIYYQNTLRQIEAKGYAAGIDTEGRQLIAVGVNFSSRTRGIEGGEG